MFGGFQGLASASKEPSFELIVSSPFLCISGCVDDLTTDDPIRAVFAEDIADMERRRDNDAFHAIFAD